MIKIIHRPYGQEHPYEQLPEERFPREPLAAQTFTVGIATQPPGAASQVTVHTRIDGQPVGKLTATVRPDWKPELEEGVGAEFLERMIRVEQDIWYAELIAPAAGQMLEYWFESGGTTSEVYAYTPAEWQESDSQVAPVSMNDDGTLSWRISPAAPQQLDTRPPDWLPALEKVEWLTDGQQNRRVRLTFDAPANEAYYGFGERYNALNQRGNILDIRCYEQYKTQGKRTYMPVPFLLSSQGYGLYVNSSRWMAFDLAASKADQWILDAQLGPDETLEMTWFGGETPFDVIGQFTRMTGQPALPPLWSFGLWMSSNEWNTQDRVLHEVEQSFRHGIRPSALVIEAWSDETTFYVWNDGQYTPKSGDHMPRYNDFSFPPDGHWPDPRAMIDRLHEQGIRVILWQIPVLKIADPDQPNEQHLADRDYFERQGFGVREAGGALYRVRPFWFRDGYLWDVTNPAARAWWLGKRAYLLDDLGIDGFKTDGGEHLWGAGTLFGDGRRGDELWNEYPRLYSQAYYEFATAKRKGDALTFSRAGFTGSQTSPAHWAGDENSTWDAYRASILAGLSAGISGIAFWGWDIGGFSGVIPSAELYLRGAAMAAFCPIMQYHSEFNQHREPNHDRTPWNIQERTGDERVVPIFREFVNLRHNLMPYIWQEAQIAAETGQPMMRALALMDANASPYQYMFGRDLLITPVTEAGASSWPVYLPEGQWCDLWTGEGYQGGETHQIAAPLERIPVFVRAGASIPLNLPEQGKLGDEVPLTSEASTTRTYHAG